MIKIRNCIFAKKIVKGSYLVWFELVHFFIQNYTYIYICKFTNSKEDKDNMEHNKLKAHDVFSYTDNEFNNINIEVYN